MMSKLFRNVRQSLIKAGANSNYLKYAIGEIILVVVGILIALQINNWNELKNERKVELGYMQNVLEDLHEDIEIDKSFSIKNHIIYGLTDSIIPPIKNSDRKKQVSELAYWVRSITMEWLIIHPVERTFEQMKSSGHLRLIKDKKVADGISDYYNSLSQFDGYIEASMLCAAEYVKAIGKIFDAELMIKILRSRSKQDAEPNDIISEDPIVINELINSLQYFNGATLLGENVSIKQNQKAENLIKLITEIYNQK